VNEFAQRRAASPDDDFSVSFKLSPMEFADQRRRDMTGRRRKIVIRAIEIARCDASGSRRLSKRRGTSSYRHFLGARRQKSGIGGFGRAEGWSLNQIRWFFAFGSTFFCFFSLHYLS